MTVFIKKYKIYIALLCVILFTIYTFYQVNDKPVYRSLLKINVHEAISSLDPTYTASRSHQGVIANIYESLLTFDQHGKIVAGIAQSWEINKNRTEITLYLRDNAYWSDGVKITSHDFLLSFQRLVSSKNPAKYFYIVDNIIKNASEIHRGKKPMSALGVQAVDDHTLKIQFTRPIRNILTILSMPNLAAIPRHIVNNKKYNNWSMDAKVSSGPYYIDEHKTGSMIILKKNDWYYDAKNVNIKKVIMTQARDSHADYAKMLNKSLDIAYIPQAYIKDISRQYYQDPSKYHYKIIKSPNDAITYITVNAKNNIFNSQVRKVIALMSNRDLIANISPWYIPTKSFIAQEVISENINQDIIRNSHRKNTIIAKNIMSKLGYSYNKRLKTSIICRPLNKIAATYIADLLNEAFFDIDVKVQDTGTFYSNMEQGNFDLGLPNWAGIMIGVNPDLYYKALQTSSKYNYSRHKNKNFDKIYQSKNDNMSMNSLKIYRVLDMILLKDKYVIPILQRVSYIMISKNIIGFEPNLAGIHLIRYMKIIE